jgi:hypothetical protein
MLMGIRLPDLKNRSVLVVGASLIEGVRASSLGAEKMRSILSINFKVREEKIKG